MNERSSRKGLAFAAAVSLLLCPALAAVARHARRAHSRAMVAATTEDIFGSADDNARALVEQGRQIFRFDTFGDETFWGDQLHLHEAIATLTPREVLGHGLKVDAAARRPPDPEPFLRGTVDLAEPAVTVRLPRANAGVGGTGSCHGDAPAAVGTD